MGADVGVLLHFGVQEFFIPDDLVSFSPPVHEALHPILASILCLAGIVFTLSFVTYETTTLSISKRLPVELFMAAGAAVCGGLGLLFLLLWTGVYV